MNGVHGSGGVHGGSGWRQRQQQRPRRIPVISNLPLSPLPSPRPGGRLFHTAFIHLSPSKHTTVPHSAQKACQSVTRFRELPGSAVRLPSHGRQFLGLRREDSDVMSSHSTLVTCTSRRLAVTYHESDLKQLVVGVLQGKRSCLRTDGLFFGPALRDDKQAHAEVRVHSSHELWNKLGGFSFILRMKHTVSF